MNADRSDQEDSAPRPPGLLRDLWAHPWGRTLLIAITVAVVSWAIRETAVITRPLADALQTVLVPLGIGFVIAYVLTPLIDVMQAWGLKRRIATPLLFLLLGVLTVLIISLGMPAMLRQSSELITRFFTDVHYVDRNDNGHYDAGEPLVRRGQDQIGVHFFEDLDGDGVLDPDERSFDSDSGEVSVQPSLVRRTRDWIEATRQRVDVLLESAPEQRALVFLDIYLQRTAAQRARLQELLAAAEGGTLSDLPPVDESEAGLEWNPAWPGPDPERIAAALESVPAEQRAALRAALVTQGQSLYQIHLDLLNAWRDLFEQEGTGLPLVEELKRSLATPPDAERLQRGERELARLREATGPAGRELLRALYRSEREDHSVLQSAIDQVRTAMLDKAATLGNWAGQGAEVALSNVGAIIEIGLGVILVPIYAFFLCLAMPALRGTLRRYTPSRGRERVLRLTSEVEQVVAAFFRGRLIVCLICAGLCSIGFIWIGVPYALLFGVLIGLATAIPLSGLLFLVPAVLLVAAEGGDAVLMRSLLVVGVYTVVQTLEATLFTPMIMGREVELHPVLLIAALVFFGNLMGVLGLLLAVPIAATLRILLREFALPRIRGMAGVPGTRRHERSPPAAAVTAPENDGG
ncbi:MAG: AI-2E family transporter [Planctomycetota bacterium]